MCTRRCSVVVEVARGGEVAPGLSQFVESAAWSLVVKCHGVVERDDVRGKGWHRLALEVTVTEWSGGCAGTEAGFGDGEAS